MATLRKPVSSNGSPVRSLPGWWDTPCRRFSLVRVNHGWTIYLSLSAPADPAARTFLERSGLSGQVFETRRAAHDALLAHEAVAPRD